MTDTCYKQDLVSVVAALCLDTFLNFPHLLLIHPNIELPVIVAVQQLKVGEHYVSVQEYFTFM